MSEAADKFFCDACKRSYLWKPELAGKRAKCKSCGQVMNIPSQPWRPEPEPASEEALYELAEPAADDAKPIRPPPLPAMAVAAAAPAGGLAPLQYQSGPTARQAGRAQKDLLVDKIRDRHVPTAVLVTGAILFALFVAQHSRFGRAEMGIGMAVFTCLALFETTVVVIFAFMIADPMGISFGTLWTAVLKLGALVVFCEAVTAWLDSMGGGFTFGFYVLSVNLLVAMAILWVGMCYFFEMDAAEAKWVVILLALGYRFLQIALFVAVVIIISKMTGALPPPIVRSSAFYTPPPPPPPPSPTMELLYLTGKHGELTEAGQWAYQQKMALDATFIKAWYAAGASNVQVHLIPVGFAHTGADYLVITLPSTKSGRARCYDLARDYYAKAGLLGPPELLKDVGDKFLVVLLPGMP
ncbi:MAG TPA: hypothetical protein VMD30_03880 [Tepidisphaeraceae bacterium]|nr:hypothetical protein [Tepidisphaeraceae bacterium]